MTKDEELSAIMGAISIELRDPTLQQGFEIICKENAELKEELRRVYSYTRQFLDNFYTRESADVDHIRALENDCDEARAQLTKARAQLTKARAQLTKARALVRRLIDLKHIPCASGHSISMLLYENICAEAEQFLKEVKDK